MKALTKIVAGLALAATLFTASPVFADTGIDWDAVGYQQFLDGNQTMRFDLPLDRHSTVSIYLSDEQIRHFADLDLRIVYPDGYTVYASEVGDDGVTIDTEHGGMFKVYVDNIDEWATNFTLYVDYV